MKLRVKCTECFGAGSVSLHYVQEVLSILIVYNYIQMDKAFRYTEYFEDYTNNFKVKILFLYVQEVVPRFI